jgi:hypothetical protein
MKKMYEEYTAHKLSESVQYKPTEEPTKVTLYADDKPYQVIDLKYVDEISEEEYNDKLKDAWLKETAYKTMKERKEEALEKYYEYEVEAEVESDNEYDFWDNFVYAMDVFLDVLPLLVAAAIIVIGVLVFK